MADPSDFAYTPPADISEAPFAYQPPVGDNTAPRGAVEATRRSKTMTLPYMSTGSGVKAEPIPEVYPRLWGDMKSNRT